MTVAAFSCFTHSPKKCREIQRGLNSWTVHWMWSVSQSTNLWTAPAKFHQCFWKSVRPKSPPFDTLVIWDNLNPALMLIHPLQQYHAAGACDTGLNQSRFAVIYKPGWHTLRLSRGPLTQIHPAVAFWAVRAGNVFTIGSFGLFSLTQHVL